MDLPCPALAVNFAMCDFSWDNGPIRQIAGTHHSHAALPSPEEEPDWMRYSTLCPIPAGSALIRDHRAWVLSSAAAFLGNFAAEMSC